MAPRTGVAVIAAGAALAAAAPAAADPPWDPPRRALDCCPVHDLAFAPSGRAIGAVDDPAGRETPIVVRSPAGDWTRHDAGRAGFVRLGVHGERVLLLGAIGFNRPRVTLTSGTTAGEFGKVRNLGAGAGPDLAVDPSGAAVAAWVRARDSGVVVMWRPPGRAFSRPFRLGVAGRTEIAAAVNGHGDAVVMWRAANRRTYLRTIGRDGRVAKSVELGRTGGTDAYDVALTDAGRWTAGWVTYRRGKYGPSGAMSARAFRGRLRSRSFATVLADTSPIVDVPRFRIELDSDGNALVAWSAIEPRRDFTGYVARYAVGGSTETVRLEDRNVFLSDVATGPGGRALLLFDTSFGPPRPDNTQDPPRMFARYRPGSGQAFGPEEPIAPGGRPQAAFDPLSGRPMAVLGALAESFRASP
jgi:hypothetical protein